jgi:hypothetical protein
MNNKVLYLILLVCILAVNALAWRVGKLERKVSQLERNDLDILKIIELSVINDRDVTDILNGVVDIEKNHQLTIDSLCNRNSR